MRLSARNQLPGVVTKLEHGAVMSTVVVRLAGGDEITAAITKDSAEELGLAVGDAVTAIVKSTEVMIGRE
ncbi:MAG TPA: TOBE domain-containing protein [Acidimicrobiales bacterium]|nr:TOBE domain-containing protein [Acidimicrobiales bacterium]